MQNKKIEVVSYSGYRGEETPRAFFLGSNRVEVVEVLERWRGQQVEDSRVKSCFRVKGDDGLVYTLCYDEQDSEWTYVLL
jgi:hypothetical protein